ncbi:unnamed protein product [Bursaphelenchus xylophilus]|uniref:(pine wood nematode) hypothetical protein n=1 Tax=Bursaphelenchus xylophilus TaxID=6326 RepID=A0A1I7RTN2_BURXY|nr:unnamed protein product [Bursaphelenchus xylophilus]CAG9122287.1 unnamed protein product [Bursaphelenchus xylophilus]
MAQNASIGHGIEDVYKSVISDVMAQVKDAFLDENVDVDVLQQLKKAWEEKVQESGAVDLEGQRPIQPPPIRVDRIQQQRQPSGSGVQPVQVQQMQPIQNVVTGIPNTQAQSSQQIHQLLLQQQQQPQVQVSNANSVTLSNQQMMILRQRQGEGFQQVVSQPGPFIVNAGGQFLTQPGGGNIQLIPNGGQIQPQYAVMQNGRMILVPGNQMPVNLANAQIINALRGQQGQGSSNGNIPQLDGSNVIDEPESSKTPKKQEVQKKKKVQIVQLDGNHAGPGLSDSSSEEEDEEEDDPLRRYAGLQDDTGGDGEANEEEPLNSDDDQSDEEDLKTLFDSDNVVVCQFEKVHRARSKWKFILKDGIMHLNGKDYCFQKCTGEAEW